MTRVVVFLIATVVAWPQLGAQANPSPTAQPAATEQAATDNSAQRTVTVTGCLGQNDANGAFTLTDHTGRKFMLAGNTATLTGHSQQEVQITGQQQFNANSESETSAQSRSQSETPAGPAESEAKATVVQVREVKIISDHCSLPTAGEKPSAERSDPPAPDQHSLRASGATRGARLIETAADGDDASTAGARELPQTSTILPLLGLIGLGSLVAGFFARR